MALQPGNFFESDTSGAQETITLVPTSPGKTTQAIIASVFYGKDASGTPISVPIAANGKSLTLTVLLGMNALVVTVVSPELKDELVSLTQGNVALSSFTVSGHTGISTIFIKGL